MDEKGKIKVMNCNTVNKQWSVTESASKKYNLINLVMI